MEPVKKNAGPFAGMARAFANASKAMAKFGAFMGTIKEVVVMTEEEFEACLQEALDVVNIDRRYVSVQILEGKVSVAIRTPASQVQADDVHEHLIPNMPAGVALEVVLDAGEAEIPAQLRLAFSGENTVPVLITASVSINKPTKDVFTTKDVEAAVKMFEEADRMRGLK